MAKTIGIAIFFLAALVVAISACYTANRAIDKLDAMHAYKPAAKARFYEEVVVLDKQGASSWRTPNGWSHAGVTPDGYPLVKKRFKVKR